MKRFGTAISLLLILGLVYYSFYDLMPQNDTIETAVETEYSTQRALIHLNEIAKAPHYHGSPEHERVRAYLLSQLKNLGLETEMQEGFVLNAASKNLDKPKNIIARLKGSGNGKALLLLSHYDSALVPSFGASDAGSGIVTILESLRAYIANGKTPKNDIIILFTDCEEIGLDGANLFVNEHPWAKDVGFVMNFEARGSGGPSVMILESNGGNANLIKAFIAAKPKYPVASSLMYSVYKILPNSTDSTVFREDGDIDSFFFAFIDDHFDYHTANDTVENLDVNTLQHQGSYLLPLLHYFADADLSNLKSEKDYVYVNFPIVSMISYPFSWIIPMLLVASILFIVLIFFGIKKNKLNLTAMGKGFIPFLLSLLVCGILGYAGWILLLKIYPQYNEVQHGFKYNGHSYLAFFVLLSVAILLRLYHTFSKKNTVANLSVAPLLFWIIINIGVSLYLKGAGFFIIPVFFGLLSLWLLIRLQKPNLLLLTFIGAPAIFLFAPLVQFFPVALGSGMVVIACVLTVLIFGLLIPVFGFYKLKKPLSMVCLFIAIGFLIKGHITNDFSKERQKPNSLIYYQDMDANQSSWLTYDAILDDWTRGYLDDAPKKASKGFVTASKSKYNTGYTYSAKAPAKNITAFETILKKDTTIQNMRHVTFTMLPKRNINQINVYANKNIQFNSLNFNGKQVPKDSAGKVYGDRKTDKLLRYIVADNDSLEVRYSTLKDIPVEFTIVSYSFDLLSNPQFTINKRPKHTMPKPFVVTDAIAVKRTIVMDALPRVTNDSITSNIDE